jgi:hypothetical protein
MADASTFPFLLLPPELRHAVYNLVIAEDILKHEASRHPDDWSCPVTPGDLGLDIVSSIARIRVFRVESSLIYTNRQIHIEMRGIIRAMIHHVRVTGDFQMGLISTQTVLNSITTRPWLAANVRTIRIVITHHSSSWENRQFWNTKQVHKYPRPFRLLKPAQDCILAYSHTRQQQGLPFLPIILPSDSERHAKAPFDQNNTLPNLARLLEGFPLLKRIDIRPDVYNTLMLWPNPMDAMICFEPFHAKGVEVNMLLSVCNRWIFCSIMNGLGIDLTKSIFWDECGKVMLNACDFNQGYADVIVARYRLFDQLPPPTVREDAI